MRTLLVASDFSTRSDRALRRAVLLARQLEAELLLVHVVDLDRPVRLVEAERREAELLLGELAETCRREDRIGCRCELRFGEAFEGVLAAAAESGAELVVLGPPRRRLLRGVLTGTTAERVIRVAAHPVLIANGVPAAPYRRVLLATDLSPGAEAAALATRRLGFDRLGTLAAVHVHPATLLLRTPVVARDAEPLRAHQRREAAARLARFLAGVGLVRARRIALAALVGLAGLVLRQPLVVSFILVGVLAGPAGFGLVRAADEVELLAELGIAVLLFLVGLKLDLGLVRSLGSVALATGLGQVVFTALFGFLLGLTFAMPPLEAFYVAVALTFSSTIIIVKLLSDKREIDSLHGRVALGFLIVQDIVVVLAMIVLAAFGVGTAADAPLRAVLLVIGSGGLLLLFVLLFVRFLADPLTERLARNPELLLLFAVATAAGGAAVADTLGLGKELGGLLAGVALASTPYRDALAARLAPLRDFLLLFFFVALGSRLDLVQMRADLVPAIAFSLFVLVGNPLIVLAIMAAMGFRKRTGFLAGLTVAQISEFSLVFVAMGVSLGHVSEAALALTTLVGLVTIAASTYMIIWSHELYALLEPLLQPFERRRTVREPKEGRIIAHDPAAFIVLGLGRFGSALASRLLAKDLTVLAMDFDPRVVRLARRQGLRVAYGDASDPERLATLPLATARWVVVTLPGLERGLTHDDPRKAILQALRAAGFSGRVAVVARSAEEESELAGSGADIVLVPFEDAADRAVELLLEEAVPVAREPAASPALRPS